MAGKESTFLNMTLTLFLISAVASLALGYIYNLTLEPIKQSKENKLKTAIGLVVPLAGNEGATIEEQDITSSDGLSNLKFYRVKNNDSIVGTAVRTISKNGFGGEIVVMVGFDNNGNIIDSDILEHKETPGLGDKSCKSTSDWNNQFKNKNPKSFILKVKKDGGDVDAITAATITSRAYCDALQRAYDTFVANTNSINAKDVVDNQVHQTDTTKHNIEGGINNE